MICNAFFAMRELQPAIRAPGYTAAKTYHITFNIIRGLADIAMVTLLTICKTI